MELREKWIVIHAGANSGHPEQLLNIRYTHSAGSATLYLSWPDCESTPVPFTKLIR